MPKNQKPEAPKKLFPKLSQLKYLSKKLNKTEKRITVLLFSIVIICLGFLIYFNYFKNIEFLPKDGGIYTEGVIGEPKLINPLYATANDVDSDITKLTFRGLMKYNKNQELEPDIAESYEISKDKKNYTFHLKKNIKWHDGQNLTADDVIYTFQTIKNPEFQSPLQISFDGVDIEKIDDYTIKFILLKTKYVPFLTENTTFGIIPKHIWQNISPKNATLSEYNLKPVGCGPYKFKEYKKDKGNGAIISYSLEKNNDFYDKKPYISEINFNFFNDYPLLINAYNKKEIQGIGFIPIEEKNNLKKKINFSSLNLPQYYALFFNTENNQALQYKAVRQALATSIDKEKIINEALNQQAIAVNSPILPNYQNYYIENKKNNFDLEKAKKILNKAGWKINKKKNLRQYDDKKLEINLLISNEPQFTKIAEIIKENWQNIGAKVNIKAIEPAELQSDYLRPRKYEALLYGQLLGHDPDPYAFWHSSQQEDPGLNLTSLQREKIDKLLESARQESNQAKRKKSYKEFQDIITKEVPAIFLYSPTYLYGFNKTIKGFDQKYLFTPSDRFSDIENWYIKTKIKYKK